MKKKYMRMMHMGMLSDLKNLEHHFSLMAEKGWMVYKIDSFFHYYRAEEPCKKNFFVDLLPRYSECEYTEKVNTEGYRNNCKNLGWTLTASHKQIYVFYSDDCDSTVPNLKSNKEQAKIYLKACAKREIPMFVLPLISLVLSAPRFDNADFLLSNFFVLTTIGFFIILITCFWEFGFLAYWFIRMCMSARRDLPLPVVSNNHARARHMTLVISAFVFLVLIFSGVILDIRKGLPFVVVFLALLMFSPIPLCLWLKRKLETNGRSFIINEIISTVAVVIIVIVLFTAFFISVEIINSILPPSPNTITLDGRPALTLADAGVTAEQFYSRTYINGSFVVPVVYEYTERYEQSNAYVITRVYRSDNETVVKWLYGRISKEFIGDDEVLPLGTIYAETFIAAFTPKQAAVWGAKEGFSVENTSNGAVILLLLNGNTILNIIAASEVMESAVVNVAVLDLWDEINKLYNP